MTKVALAAEAERSKALELHVRRSIVTWLKSTPFKNAMLEDGNVFHRALLEIKRHSLAHYSRVADVMDLNPSVASRWFADNDNTVPEEYRRLAAVKAILMIIEHDLERLAKNQEIIGHKLIKVTPNDLKLPKTVD